MNSIMFCQTLLWCETFSTFITIEVVNLFCLAPVSVQMLLKINFGSKSFTTMITYVFCAFHWGFVFLKTLFRYKYRFANITFKYFSFVDFTLVTQQSSLSWTRIFTLITLEKVFLQQCWQFKSLKVFGPYKDQDKDQIFTKKGPNKDRFESNKDQLPQPKLMAKMIDIAARLTYTQAEVNI